MTASWRVFPVWPLNKQTNKQTKRHALVFDRLTLPWLWTQTVIQMRRGLRRARTAKTNPPPAALLRSPPCTARPSRRPLPPAPPLAPAPAPARHAVRVRTMPLSRKLVRSPTPCPPPAPGPSLTMTGLMILQRAQWSASTQECRETKVFTLLNTGLHAHCVLWISNIVSWASLYLALQWLWGSMGLSTNYMINSWFWLDSGSGVNVS